MFGVDCDRSSTVQYCTVMLIKRLYLVSTYIYRRYPSRIVNIVQYLADSDIIQATAGKSRFGYKKCKNKVGKGDVSVSS